MLRRLREQLASGPNRIATSTALRATIAAGTPLAVLSNVGLAGLAHPAVLGAIATSMVDVGGPYRTRLIAMMAQALGGSALLLLGSTTLEHWWLASALMGLIAIAFGLIRALGPGGASLGTNSAVAFLVGIQIGEVAHAGEATVGVVRDWALGYSVGGIWTVVVALAFWQLRPYRRLEQEMAGVWESVATLLVTAALRPLTSGPVARRRRDQRVAADHAATRVAIEQARNSIGEMRAGTAGPGTTTRQLVVLLDAAAGVAGTAVALCELSGQLSEQTRSKLDELARACRALARVLLAGKGELSSIDPKQPLPLESELPEGLQPADFAVLSGAMRHLDDAQEALRVLFGVKHRLPDLLRIPVAHRLPRGAVIDALRAHATPRSAIFRHSMRIAAVTACDTALLIHFRLPHGIWLPLTSLVVMQPEYGGTIRRALQRTLGTVAGAVIASALLATLRHKVAFDEALTALLFATFLLIRRNYGYGITFLTPIVILLIGMSSANPWLDLEQRVIYTVAGSLLALAAAFLLWPQWERDQLRQRLARALDSNREFLLGALQSLSDASLRDRTLPGLRRQAELAIANAEAGFQRMLAEPTHKRPLVNVGLGLIIHLQRLCRHAVALSAQPLEIAVAEQPLERLRGLVDELLSDVSRVVGEQRRAVPWPSIDSQLTELVAQLDSKALHVTPSASTAALTFMLGSLIDDLTGLLRTVGYGHGGGVAES